MVDRNHLADRNGTGSARQIPEKIREIVEKNRDRIDANLYRRMNRKTEAALLHKMQHRGGNNTNKEEQRAERERQTQASVQEARRVLEEHRGAAAARKEQDKARREKQQQRRRESGAAPRATTVSGEVYESARNAAVSVSTFYLHGRATESGDVIASGSGFMVPGPFGILAPNIVVGAAHVAMPDFHRLNENTFPYFVNPGPDYQPGPVPVQYGLSYTDEWPFVYIGDVYNALTGRREFRQLCLVGMDWNTDLAFYIVLSDPCGSEFLGENLNLALFAPEVGDRVYALSDLFGTKADILDEGIVRQTRYQHNALFVSLLSTSLSLDLGSSGAAILNEDGEVGAVHLGAAVDGMDYTLAIDVDQLFDAYLNFVYAVLVTDQIAFPDVFTIVVAITDYSLAADATLLKPDLLRFPWNTPPNRGYVFKEAEPGSDLQSQIKWNDLIVKVDDFWLSAYPDPDPDTPVPGGSYTLNEVINAATSSGNTEVTVHTIRWTGGGYPRSNDCASIYQPPFRVKLLNDVGDFWMWWFRWALLPAGFARVAGRVGSTADAGFSIDESAGVQLRSQMKAADGTHGVKEFSTGQRALGVRVTSMPSEAMVKRGITRPQSRRIPALTDPSNPPGETIFPLTTESLRVSDPDQVSGEESSRVDNIWKQVDAYLRVLFNASLRDTRIVSGLQAMITW